MTVPAAKWVMTGVPAAILDNAAMTAVVVDTNGFDYAEIAVFVGATDIAMANLAIKESDDNSTNTNVTGTVWGTAVDVDGTTTALPSSTNDNTIQLFNLDLRKRKRYLQVLATAGDGSAGTYLASACRLSRAKELPVTSAEQGAEHAVTL